MKNWMRIARVFDDSVLAALNSSRGERASIVDAARQKALSLCTDDQARTEVECRALEAHLKAAGARGGDRKEIEELMGKISTSRFFNDSRKDDVLSMGSAMLRRMP